MRRRIGIVCILVFASATPAVAQGPLGGQLAREAVRIAAGALLENALEDWLTHTAEIRQRSALQNVPNTEFFVSTDLAIQDIPREIADHVQARKDAIRGAILATAAAIESEEYGEVAVEDGRFTTAARTLEGIHETNVSMRSFQQAVVLMADLSEVLLEEVRATDDPDERFWRYVEYNAFVYEITNLTIEILNDLELSGASDLEELYQRSQAEIDAAKARLNAIVESSQRLLGEGKISEAAHSQTTAMRDNNFAALDRVEERWQPLLGVIDRQEDWIENARSQGDQLKLTRNSASAQLHILKIIRTVTEVQNHFESVAAITSIVVEIPVLVVTPEDAEFMMGPLSRLEDANPGGGE